MLERSAQDAAREFYYFGFFRALQRFRTFTIIGWILAASGVAAMVLRWAPFWTGDLTALVLCALLIASGIVIVHVNVAALTAYLQIPFPPLKPDEGNTEFADAVGEIVPLMKEVDEGGWQDAFRVLHSLRAIGVRYGFPPPDSDTF
jgi:hypothetical protein